MWDQPLGAIRPEGIARRGVARKQPRGAHERNEVVVRFRTINDRTLNTPRRAGPGDAAKEHVASARDMTPFVPRELGRQLDGTLELSRLGVDGLTLRLGRDVERSVIQSKVAGIAEDNYPA